MPNSPRSARIAEVIGVARALGQKRVGQVEQLLEIAVPGGQPQVVVEHRHAVGHVVEGDAQFGLALADFVEQPGILDRDHRLVGEGLDQRDLLVGERLDMVAQQRDDADRRASRSRGTESVVRFGGRGGGSDALGVAALVEDVVDLLVKQVRRAVDVPRPGR